MCTTRIKAKKAHYHTMAEPPRVALLPVEPLRVRAPPGQGVTYVQMPTAPPASPIVVGLLILLIIELVLVWAFTTR